MSKKLWAVTVPIAGHAYVVVEADSKDEAIDKAIDEASIDNLETWQAMRQFNEGNICYCPHPWEAEAVDETPDDEEAS